MEGYGEIVVATLHYFMLVFIGMGTCLWLSLLSLEVLVALARGGGGTGPWRGGTGPRRGGTGPRRGGTGPRLQPSDPMELFVLGGQLGARICLQGYELASVAWFREPRRLFKHLVGKREALAADAGVDSLGRSLPLVDGSESLARPPREGDRKSVV